MASGSADTLKRRSREWDGAVMNTEVFETPEPEVTFRPYAAVQRGGSSIHGNSAFAPEDGHVFDKMSMELDEDIVAPTQAFEAFMGKVYKPTPLPSTLTELESTGGKPSNANRGAADLESPLQRFTRLTMEIKELETDLALLAEAKQPSGDKSIVVDAAQDAEFSEIMQGLATLQLNLAAVEQNAKYQSFLQPTAGVGSLARGQVDAVASMQRDLTAKFFQQIDALKSHQQGQTHGSSSNAPIVYEIFSNGDLNAVDRDAKTRVLALESRIATLEALIGATNPKELHVDGLRASAAASADLSSIIDELDQRVGLLNEKNLDAIKARTTALVHEFTLLHKLKESPAVQGALSSLADREKINQIYEKLNSVQEVAASVPAIVDRLVSLKAVHDESLDLSGRVKKLEQSQSQLNELLQSDEALLANIEKSLHDNVQIFQNNIETLDARMNQLLRGASQ